MAEPTVENVLLALVPIAVMAAMQTTMIRASMTAYSTAVGPSSFFTKLTRLFVIARIVVLRSWKPGCYRNETETGYGFFFARALRLSSEDFKYLDHPFHRCKPYRLFFSTIRHI